MYGEEMKEYKEDEELYDMMIDIQKREEEIYKSKEMNKWWDKYGIKIEKRSDEAKKMVSII